MVVVRAGGDSSTVVRGADPDADFEIGSVTKGVTGLLYRDAVAREEVTAETTLSELLPLQGTRAGRITLGSLAVHRSGLPRLPRSAQPLRKTVELWRRGTNPYGEPLAELLDQVREVAPSGSRPRYSNLGFELLGHAVAAAAGSSYAELVRTRLTDPLELGAFYVGDTPAALRQQAMRGVDRLGRPMEPWTGEALGPAGGIRATGAAMARLLAALLDRTAPGVDALDPVEDLAGPAVRIGAGWVVTSRKGRVLTWHNGGTGGFRSWLGMDRAAGTGVVVLSARSTSVDGAGLELLRRL